MASNPRELNFTLKSLMHISSVPKLLNVTIKICNNKCYNGVNTIARLENLCLKTIEFSKNDIYKCACNSLELLNVTAYNNEIRRITIKENLF